MIQSAWNRAASVGNMVKSTASSASSVFTANSPAGPTRDKSGMLITPSSISPHDKDPVKIRIVSSSNVLSSELLKITGHEESTAGSFKWYRVTNDGAFLPIDGVAGASFQPSVDDVGDRICAQYIPDYGDPSNFAEVGPVSPDPSLSQIVSQLLSGGSELTVRRCSDQQSYNIRFNTDNTMKIISSSNGDSTTVVVNPGFKCILTPSSHRFCITNESGAAVFEAETNTSKDRCVVAMVVRQLEAAARASRPKPPARRPRAPVVGQTNGPPSLPPTLPPSLPTPKPTSQQAAQMNGQLPTPSSIKLGLSMSEKQIIEQRRTTKEVRRKDSQQTMGTLTSSSQPATEYIVKIVVLPIRVRSAPAYPGEKMASCVEVGTRHICNDRVVVRTGDAEINYYRLNCKCKSHGPGWIFDYDPNSKSVLLAVTSNIPSATKNPSDTVRLGLSFGKSESQSDYMEILNDQAIEINKLRRQLQKLRVNHMALQKGHASGKTRNETLRGEVEQYKKNNEARTLSIGRLEQTNAHMANSLSESGAVEAALKDKLSKTEQQLTGTMDRLRESDMKLVASTKRVSELEELVRTLSATSTDANSAADQNRLIIDDLRAQLADEREKTRATEQSVTAMQERYDDMTRELTQLKSHVGDLENAKRTDSVVKRGLSEQVEELQVRLSKVQGLSSEADERHARTTKELKHLMQGFDAMKLRLSEQNLKDAKCARREDKLQKQIYRYAAASTRQDQEVAELRQRLAGSVPKHESQALNDAYEHLKTKLQKAREENNVVNEQLNEHKRSYSGLQLETDKLKGMLETSKGEEQRMMTERNFFKKKADSMLTDLQKMMRFGNQAGATQTRTATGHAETKWMEERHAYENQIAELKNANDDALRAVKTYKTELNRQLQMNKQSQSAAQKAVQQYHDAGSLGTKNSQLQQLANSLSDALSDKEQYIQHLKSTLKLLGDRVRELESELAAVRRNSVLGLSKEQPDMSQT